MNCITTGDLHFQNTIGSVECKFHEASLDSLFHLLSKCDEEHQQLVDSIRTISTACLTAYRSYMGQHMYLTNRIGIVRTQADKILLFLRFHCQTLIQRLRESKQATETEILKNILAYFQILKEELSASRKTRSADDGNTDCLKQAIKRRRELSDFAVCLESETNSAVKLQPLAFDSAQSIRCRKAVADNMKKQLSALGVSINVANIYKLENSLISQKLQNAASSIEKGKVKGLFCALSRRHIYNFCAYGILAQNLPGFGPPKLPEVFHTPWYTYPGYSVAGSPVRGSPRGLRGTSGSPFLGQEAPYFAKARRMVQDSLHYAPMDVQFSRHSTPSILTNDGVLRDAVWGLGSSCAPNVDAEEENPGVYLALCRVLIVKLCTVAGAVTKSDILAAVSQGYDAIYSNLTEEYILLNGYYVLPEFIMDITFEIGQNSQDGLSPSVLSSEDNHLWIPSLDKVKDKKQKSPKHPSKKSLLPFSCRMKSSTPSVQPFQDEQSSYTSSHDFSLPHNFLASNRMESHLSDSAREATSLTSSKFDIDSDALHRKQVLVESIGKRIQNFSEYRRILIKQFASEINPL